MKKHLLFDKRSMNYAKFGRKSEVAWITAYPQTLCWMASKGKEVVENIQDATCLKCLKSAKKQFIG